MSINNKLKDYMLVTDKYIGDVINVTRYGGIIRGDQAKND